MRLRAVAVRSVATRDCSACSRNIGTQEKFRPFRILLRKSYKVALKYAKKVAQKVFKIEKAKLLKNFAKLLEYF